MSKDDGLKEKYLVNRIDGQPITCGCVVLEFTDRRAVPALAAWADTMERSGYGRVAQDVRYKIDDLHHGRASSWKRLSEVELRLHSMIDSAFSYLRKISA